MSGFKIPTLLATLVLAVSAVAWAVPDYPVPSSYPIAWELKFKHGTPTRIAVDLPGKPAKAYWYMTYTVTNNTDKEHEFLPDFTMMTRTGQIIRSDNNIPQNVFQAIKKREGDRFLESWPHIDGKLLLGEDEAKDGVAIWREPDRRMGNFTIFVSGLSGEAVQLKGSDGQPMKDADGNPVILHKTLQLNYIVRGDDVYPGQDEVDRKSEDEVMR